MTTTSANSSHANTHHGGGGAEPPAVVRAAGVIVAVTALLAILAVAFALPATRSGPHDVPIGAAGPQAAGQGVADMLEQKRPGAFAVTYYPSEAALTEAIENREVYGGIALPTQSGMPPTVLIATGGSPMVAQMLTQLGAELGQRVGIPPRTVDLAPPSSRDPRGAGLAASALPITLAGIIPAIALILAVRTEVWTRLAAAVVFAGVAGVTIAALLRYVTGTVEHNFWGVAAGLTLGVGAALLAILGLGSLFGRTGLAAGAALAILVGNPLSGLTSAPELLPAGWGQLGQLLPQGATATLLRSTVSFGGAGATTAVIVLTCWALAGTAMVVVAAVRRQRTASA
jgi:hypothetical protein